MIFNPPTPIEKFVWNVFMLFPPCMFIIIIAFVIRRFFFEHTLSCTCVGG